MQSSLQAQENRMVLSGKALVQTYICIITREKHTAKDSQVSSEQDQNQFTGRRNCREKNEGKNIQVLPFLFKFFWTAISTITHTQRQKHSFLQTDFICKYCKSVKVFDFCWCVSRLLSSLILNSKVWEPVLVQIILKHELESGWTLTSGWICLTAHSHQKRSSIVSLPSHPLPFLLHTPTTHPHSRLIVWFPPFSQTGHWQDLFCRLIQLSISAQTILIVLLLFFIFFLSRSFFLPYLWGGAAQRGTVSSWEVKSHRSTFLSVPCLFPSVS